MSVYKLYAAFTASADGAASLDIQFDGLITGVNITMVAPDMGQSAEEMQVEASFLSTSTFSANDSRGVIASAGQCSTFTTSGGANPAINHFLAGLKVPVTAGERIYLHGKVTGTFTARTTVTLYVEDESNPLLRRRR